jgi:carbon storage regulator
MLVLSRKQKQSIRIGEDIEITVVQVQGNRVRLAIQAPKHVSIQRDEIATRIAQELESSTPLTALAAAS